MNTENTIKVKGNSELPKICTICGNSAETTKPYMIKDSVPLWLVVIFPLRFILCSLMRLFNQEVSIFYYHCKKHRRITSAMRFLGVLSIIIGGIGEIWGLEKNKEIFIGVGAVCMLIGIYWLFFYNKIRAKVSTEDNMFLLSAVSEAFRNKLGIF